MTIILFLVVLAVLVFVHELGHFVAAKRSGIRVDEFAIGFPPKIIGWTRGETKYALNLIPFGGYVKIFGENPDEESIAGPDSARSFVKAKKWKQAVILLSGIGMNIVFAWVLISISFMFGSLIPVGEGNSSAYSNYVQDSRVMLTSIQPGSPAALAGLQQGDRLLAVGTLSGSALTADSVRAEVEKTGSQVIAISYERSGETRQATATPVLSGERPVIGIYMENVGIVKLNPFLAFWEGGKLTVKTFGEVITGLGSFFYKTAIGQGDFSQVSGPVGIAGLVGDAAHFGLAYFLGFVAFISLNLAAINLIPFPALDGGRVLFVCIEAIIRRPIKPVVANILNSVGFFILIGLMLVITYRDIVKIF